MAGSAPPARVASTRPSLDPHRARRARPANGWAPREVQVASHALRTRFLRQGVLRSSVAFAPLGTRGTSERSARRAWRDRTSLPTGQGVVQNVLRAPTRIRSDSRLAFRVLATQSRWPGAQMHRPACVALGTGEHHVWRAMRERSKATWALRAASPAQQGRFKTPELPRPAKVAHRRQARKLKQPSASQTYRVSASPRRGPLMDAAHKVSK